MNRERWVVAVLALAALALLVSGCSSSPISRELREQARPITFNQVKFDPEGTSGTVVMWGGRVISVVNNTNGGSIYIMALPLRGGGKPRTGQPSPGRFIAASPGFLDPVLFPPGRRITVAGPLDGIWTEPLDEMDYTYPVLQISQVHVWHPDSPPPSGTVTMSAGPRPSWNVYMGPAWGPPPPMWWYYPWYRPAPGFRGGFHVNAGVRVGPPPRRRRW